MKSLKKNEIELTVGDNGVGIPDEVDIRETKSLGLHLVSILAEDQLRGKIKLDKTKGTRFEIIFKAKQ
jgi:two-component sensor histidine kinase